MNIKRLYAVLTLLLAGLLFTRISWAVSDYDTIIAGVSFDSLKAAFATVFASMVGVGIFIKGGSMIARKLGFR
ncbi:hypothetical protein [Methylomonas sp. UP202]|uniref:hypothetical protein n=1 Tax=Methylomonas sp. UP202 TaxID=3040943 RepID=UPI00247A6944|nr:hypothetical protein [Methylomonas sp. UP202]WGS84974.1 hypothetical protein QC632_18245 [Methylomonas sp. UP202]